MSKSTVRRTLTAVAVGGALALGVAAGATPARADIVFIVPGPSPTLDQHIPNPPIWCPGGGNASGFGAYCEGVSYPDGSRWNLYRVFGLWQPIRCILPDGSMNPPLAGPGACGGVA